MNKRIEEQNKKIDISKSPYKFISSIYYSNPCIPFHRKIIQINIGL